MSREYMREKADDARTNTGWYAREREPAAPYQPENSHTWIESSTHAGLSMTIFTSRVVPLELWCFHYILRVEYQLLLYLKSECFGTHVWVCPVLVPSTSALVYTSFASSRFQRYEVTAERRWCKNFTAPTGSHRTLTTSP